MPTEDMKTECPECGRDDYKVLSHYNNFGILLSCNNCKITYFCDYDKEPVSFLDKLKKFQKEFDNPKEVKKWT